VVVCVALVLAGGAGAAAWELRTSTLQARYFSGVARRVDYVVAPGPSPLVRFPAAGPADQRLGYTAIPEMVAALETHGFRIDRQARVSAEFAALVDRGVYPLYPEKLQGGLVVRDAYGTELHASPTPREVYAAFDDIPEVLWRALLFIESREFLDEHVPQMNPAVEWDRLARSAFELALETLGSDRNAPGGSTLATQLEKFRHSPDGRTDSVRDKLLQMETAALRAYLDGPDTLDARRRVVRDYLNSVPLAAQLGHGEVVGTAEGLFVWYGTPFAEANGLLRDLTASDERDARRAEVLRQAVSLLIAHRRPTYYLAQAGGREDLVTLTDSYLQQLAVAGVVSDPLAQAARAARSPLLPQAPPRPVPPFVPRKAATQVRTDLLSLLPVTGLYDLDRLDLVASSTLDLSWQQGVTDLFQDLQDREQAAALGFTGERMLDRGEPAHVVYAFTLMETTPLGNVVRVQTDTYDGPLSFSEASRVELGSTAKLRTLATYLEAIATLHQELSGLSPDALRAMPVPRQDALTRWVRDQLLAHPGADLRSLLDAAMERRYSASPVERFATGGGTQTFANFDRTYDHAMLPVSEAFQQTVNLPLIRVMRDVVNYYLYRSPGTTARVLDDLGSPSRQEYLARFADREGSQFLRQFHRKYRAAEGAVPIDVLLANRRLGPQRTAWAIRAVLPDAEVEQFSALLEASLEDGSLTRAAVEDLYRRSDPAAHGLSDLGYLARVHPLELWLARWLTSSPASTLPEMLDASREARQEVYGWLFRTSRRNAQDQRIRTLLELEAFEAIHQSWQRLGYPFAALVPSYGTAIGSSGDRPAALAELLGIILNEGMRYPTVRVDALLFAEGTPFETRLARAPATGEQVMHPTVAAVLRQTLVDVVERGTGRRARGALLGVDGEPLVVGGKTGTGDNRFQVFGAGGRLLESRPVNRTATFAFLAGDRFFGVVTAYVPGREADEYRFTSALPAEILRRIGAILGPMPVRPAGAGVTDDE
jgi:membrane peptidoglycan carboxypeptidase